jgi:hypothetical protein
LGGKPWKRTPLDLPLLLLVGTGVVSAVFNQVPPIVLLMGLRITLRYALLFYLVVQIGYSTAQARRLLLYLLGMATLVIGIGLVQAIVGPPMNEFLRVSDIQLNDTTRRAIRFVMVHGRYIFSTLGRYDAFGIYALYILLIVLAWIINHPQRHRGWYFLGVATVIGLILSLSRQAWLAGYIALWVWAIAARKKWAALILLVLFAVPVLIVLLAFAFPDLVRYYSASEMGEITFVSRLLSSFSEDYIRVSSSAGGRLFVLREVSQRILELSPLTGFGPGRFGTLTASYYGYSNAEILGMTQGEVYLVYDVNWVTLLGQYGTIGVIAFLLVFRAGWYKAVSLYRTATDPFVRTVALAASGIVPAFLVLGFFGPNFEQRIVAMYPWLLLALVMTLSRHSSQAP